MHKTPTFVRYERGE